jgi:DNA-binding transcriptional MerR regulator
VVVGVATPSTISLPVRWKVKRVDGVRIGELAALTGTPPKTIRFYEDIRVLPAPARTASQYRDYDQTAVSHLRFIRAAQALGLSLGEIREVISFRDRGETPCAHVADLLQRRAAELDERITELQRLRDELVRLAGRARRLDPRNCDPSLVCHVIP